MERKIGEIFEYNGEWYQTVKLQGKCCSCDFMIDGHCIVDFSSNGSCFYCHRKDKENVIFKKLEKVGEPYMDGGKIMQKYKRVYREPIYFPYKELNCYNDLHGRICIEIKQTKEDMEDLDKIKVRDYTKVEELNVMEEKKLNLKPFDIQKAREGKPVCTMSRKKARIICFDAKGILPIIALVESGDEEKTVRYSNSGRFRFDGTPDEEDLMMLPEKKGGWVNVYKERVYGTKEEAIKAKYDGATYVDTVNISWEE